MKILLPVKPEPFNLPEEFSKLATVVAACDLRPNEKDAFETVCRYIVAQLRSDGVTPPDMPTNIFFVNGDNITLQFDPQQLGNYFVGICYPVHRWRAANLTDRKIMTCMVEEMCHVFWCIRDEAKVNYKVLDVMRVGQPTLDLEDLYPYTRFRWNLRL